tara:strand:+ start:1419 stop:1655 length:237 start_codon:yes stop_codon:yes gene_type:complete
MEKQSDNKQEGTLSLEENTSSSIDQSTSATSTDIPEFGWSAYAERINGRFAMIGFIAILLIEGFSRISFLEWAGIMSG